MPFLFGTLDKADFLCEHTETLVLADVSSHVLLTLDPSFLGNGEGFHF